MICSVVLLFSLQVALIFSTPSGSGVCPTIISKGKWGGNTTKKIEYTPTPLEHVIIHHTATPSCTGEEDCSRRLVNMQNYHMKELGHNDITYNFMIGGDGDVYEGTGWHTMGSHSPGWNARSIGIAFIGNFVSKLPTCHQLDAAKSLIQCAVELGELRYNHKLLGARSVKATESPGRVLFKEIQSWRGFTRRP